MKVTVIGAGAVGSVIAHDLSHRPGIDHVQVCDSSARALQQVQDWIGQPSLRVFQIDARDLVSLEPVVRGSACVVSSVPAHLNPALAELCLSLGVHFCDLGGNAATARQELALEERAREKGVWIVPNCGLAPGLVNIVGAYGMEQFDVVDAVQLRVGDVPLHAEPPFDFRLSGTAEKVIADYTAPVQYIDEGHVIEGEPLSGVERIVFDEPFGEMEAFFTAGSPFTLVEELAGTVRHLDHKTIRRPGHAGHMRFLLGLGLGDDRIIDVRTHLTYRDVLVRRMRQRLGGAYEDAVLMRVVIRGRKEGRPESLVVEMIERFDATTGVTAMRRCTGIPAATVAFLLATHQVAGGGAAPPERIIPRRTFLDLVAARGLHLTTRRTEGHADVAGAAGA